MDIQTLDELARLDEERRSVLESHSPEGEGFDIEEFNQVYGAVKDAIAQIDGALVTDKRLIARVVFSNGYSVTFCEESIYGVHVRWGLDGKQIHEEKSGALLYSLKSVVDPESRVAALRGVRESLEVAIVAIEAGEAQPEKVQSVRYEPM